MCILDEQDRPRITSEDYCPKLSSKHNADLLIGDSATLYAVMAHDEHVGKSRVENIGRTLEFWRRAGGIYCAYKGKQLQAQVLKRRGWDAARLKEEHWAAHHAWAGEKFYRLAVDLRGFYLKE